MAYKLSDKIVNKTLLQLCLHGINDKIFRPLSDTDENLKEFRKKIFGNRSIKFSILYNSRNINRKRTSNIILAYRQFCDSLSKEEASQCVLIIHSEIVSDAGTNLIAVKEALCPEYHIIFSPGNLSPEDMNMLYNSADVTVCASSNEGFGLSTAESVMAGTPIIVAVTGGLQSQCGFIDENGNPIEFNGDFGSNNIGRYTKCGKWAYPVFPTALTIQGSPPTPYLFDDITKWEDFAEGMMYWYLMDASKRQKCGDEGRRWARNEGGINSINMAKTFMEGMDFMFENWRKPQKFDLYTISDHAGNTMVRGHAGFPIQKINKEKILEKLNSI